MAPYVELSKIGMNLKPQRYIKEVKEMFDPIFEKRRNPQTIRLPSSPTSEQENFSGFSKPIMPQPQENLWVNRNFCPGCRIHQERIEFYERIITILVLGILAKFILDAMCKKKSGSLF